MITRLSVTALDLSRNQLTDLPSQISTLSLLESVILDSNQLEILPPILYDCPSLREIVAKDNKITGMGTCVGDEKLFVHLKS